MNMLLYQYKRLNWTPVKSTEYYKRSVIFNLTIHRISYNFSRKKQDIPFINGLLLLLVWLDKPLANTNKAPVHEAALQQVVNGFEQERSTLIG